MWPPQTGSTSQLISFPPTFLRPSEFSKLVFLLCSYRFSYTQRFSSFEGFAGNLFWVLLNWIMETDSLWFVFFQLSTEKNKFFISADWEIAWGREIQELFWNSLHAIDNVIFQLYSSLRTFRPYKQVPNWRLTQGYGSLPQVKPIT